MVSKIFGAEQECKKHCTKRPKLGLNYQKFDPKIPKFRQN
jgi:hypothetical protein